MPKPLSGVNLYERITAYDEKTKKTVTVSQMLKGKIKAGAQETTSTRPKKRKGEGGFIGAIRQHTGLTDILEWVGKVSRIDDDVLASSARVMRPRFSPLHATGSAPTAIRCLALRAGR